MFKFIGLLFVSALALASFSFAGDKPGYIGEWSNGRGETLTITAKTIQFAHDKPVAYRDITRASDGKSFQLQITAAGETNAFDGKFLYIRCGDDEMTIRQFRTAADLAGDTNVAAEVTWFRDTDD